MKIYIAHTGKHDLILQTSGNRQVRVRPLTWWQSLWRYSAIEMPLGDNELLILRTDAATEPHTGLPLRNAV